MSANARNTGGAGSGRNGLVIWHRLGHFYFMAKNQVVPFVSEK